MNILVLGANGMAGHTISLYFLEKGYKVTTLTRKPFNIGENLNLTLNSESIGKLKAIVNENNFNVIINCVGILNQNAEEKKEDAVFINSYLPHYLSQITKNSKTKIVHMSTDCVFSGLEGSYKETSFTDGRTFYDRSKALGELNDNKNLTFRNSIIGPDINYNGIGLFNWFMKQQGEIKGYQKALWTGVTTLTLAKAIEAAIDQNISGLYNLVNNQVINKYDLLKIFNENFKGNSINIIPDNNLEVNKSLVNTRTDFRYEVPSYEKMIEEMKEWINDHIEYYPHYIN